MPAALVCDDGLGQRHVLSAVTRHAVEDMGGQTRRVLTAQDRLPLRDLAHDQGDALVVPIVVEDLLKRAEQRAQCPFRSTDDRIVRHAHDLFPVCSDRTGIVFHAQPSSADSAGTMADTAA
jgi:hypothetical protein